MPKWDHSPSLGRGKAMAWDVTVPDTYAVSHIGSTATKPGAAALKTAQNKIDKYAKLASTHIFTHLLWRQLVHDTTWPLSWHNKLTGASQSSQRTPGKQHSFSNAYP